MRKTPMGLAAVLAVAVFLSGCANYITRDEYDGDMGELRGADADLKARLDDMQFRFNEMSNQLHQKFQAYDASIAEFQGRLRVEMTAHFAYDDATLRETDKPALAEFSEIVGEHHDNVIVTVEGFTDPAGSADYNQQLGLRRANAVRDYLIDSGLEAERVRAVSYGEASNRQVVPNAWGEAGAANRRVALVIDYVGESGAE